MSTVLAPACIVDANGRLQPTEKGILLTEAFRARCFVLAPRSPVFEYGTTSGRCFGPRNDATADGTPIVLSAAACKFARFWVLSSGSIQHVASGKCLHPYGGSTNPPDSTQLVLWSSCNEARLAFTHHSYGALQHTSSGKCLHPEGNTVTPAEGTNVVVSTGCYHVWSMVTREFPGLLAKALR